MNLNFTFRNWNQACLADQEHCIRVIAVHEFGHALGFAHEQNRPDRPATCTDAPQGTQGDTLVGAWDLQSVMNYCNPTYNGNGRPSATDIEMVQRYYGTPAISGGSLFVATARRSPNQHIAAYDPATRKLRATIDIPQDSADRLISDVIASPDGKRLYVVNSVTDSSRAEATTLVVIDTASNGVISTLPLGQAVADLRVSHDSKTLYVLQSAGNASKVRLIDTATFGAHGEIPLDLNASLLANPRKDTDTIYAMASDAGASKQIIAQMSVSGRKVTRLFPVGTPGSRGLDMALAVDEKKMYILSHAANDDKIAAMAVLDLSSGSYVTLAPFAADSQVTSLQVLDYQRVMFGNASPARGPAILNVNTGVVKDGLVASGLSKTESVPYVVAASSKTIFAMSSDGSLDQLVPQPDGTYQVTVLSAQTTDLHGGAIKHPFAFAKAH
jgi:YVTN family beta-propeller protein